MPKLPPTTELTPKEAAALIGVNTTTIYRWIEAGEVRYRHVGKRYFLLWQDLEPMVDTHDVTALEG